MKKVFLAAETLFFCALMVAAVAVLIIIFPNDKEIPAWVQAIGSIAAILAAIGVFYFQSNDAKRAAAESEKNEIRNILRSIHDEIFLITGNFKTRNGKLLSESEPGTAFIVRMPFTDRLFPVYHAYLPNLGKIPDADLRRKIIQTYGFATAFIHSIKMNNGLVEKFEEASYNAYVIGDEFHQAVADNTHQILCQYGDSLRKLYAETVAKADDLIASFPDEVK